MSHICHTIQRSSRRMSREKYARIAEETLNAVEAGKYKTVSGRAIPIKALVDYSVSRTLLYRPGEPDDLDDKVKEKLNYSPKISVTNESTLVAGKRLQDKNPCVLNFASAKNPGGGFIRGSVAQEETIARASALYESLQMCPEFYRANKFSIKKDSSFYLDYAIYSPNVPVFRDDSCMWLDDPYLMSVVTSPAPMRPNIERAVKAGELKMSIAQMEAKIEQTFESRLAQVLKVMADNGHRTIVLGAWGCGVFGNDLEMVTSIFKRGLKFNPWFDEVVFAIYDDPQSDTYKTFKREFG